MTTGFGFSWKTYGLRENVDLVVTPDTITSTPSGLNYSRNRLSVSYFQVPLLLEFNTHADNEEGFYLATGIIGGVKMTSKANKKETAMGMNFLLSKRRLRLNSFTADATVRLGYKNWGAQATYNLIPMFDTNKTVAVHPVSFGLSYNF